MGGAQDAKPIFDVYGRRINDPNAPRQEDPLAAIRGSDLLDPRNNMPLQANQAPCPGQRKPLSTERVASNIPKGGTASTWLFPSPQMVFNGEQRAALDARHGHGDGRRAALGILAHAWSARTAVHAALKRKGKGDDVTEDDMDGFVAAHNGERPAAAGHGPHLAAREQ